MLSWTRLMHLGDLGFTVPLAGAITTALVAAGAHRFALSWSALFCLAMLAVAADKISFMTWGVGVASLNFRAASGHAAGASATFPLLFYLCGQLIRQHATRAPPWPAANWPRHHAAHCHHSLHAELAAGVGVGAVVAAILVQCKEHSPAEALVGWAMGAAASLFCIAHAHPPPLGHVRASALWFVLTFIAAAWLMHLLPVAAWMVRSMIHTAHLLAGARGLHALAPD